VNVRHSRKLFFLLLTFIFTSCQKAPPPDGVCSYEPLPAGADVPAGQGGVLTAAATDAYFYAFDPAGKQIGTQVSNRLLALKPGDYQLKVNNSTHPISLPAKMLAKCATGSVQAVGKTDEYYYIFDGAGSQLATGKLGSAISLFPGKFQARLNNTPAVVDIAANAVTELKPGTLNILGSTDEYYYVFNTTGAQLATSKLGRALSLFAGNYTVKVNNSSAPVTIAAAGSIDISSGALLVQGTTDEYYYVFNAMGTQLATSKLGRAVALLEGSYTAKVNNAGFPVKVDPTRTNEYQTGALTVKGSGSDYYYVFDANGTQLGSNKLNQPLSFPAGNYSVKVGANTRAAAVTAGQSSVVNW
jgi:hypothetical protein